MTKIVDQAALAEANAINAAMIRAQPANLARREALYAKAHGVSLEGLKAIRAQQAKDYRAAFANRPQPSRWG